MNLGEFDSALILFQEHIEKETNFCKDFVFAASICSKIGKKTEAYKYLDFALKCGLDTVEIFTLSTFKSLKNDSIWNIKFSKSLNLYNPNLRSTLLDLKKKDQQLLQFYSIPKSDVNWKVFKNKFDSTQKAHEKFVLNLIDSVGIIQTNVVGKDAQFVLLLVLQHSWDVNLRLKYYSQFKNATLKNNFDKQMFALFHDRVKIEMGKKQLYGSQYFKSDIDGKMYLFPIKKFNSLIKRRIKMEMENFEKFVSRNNIQNYNSNKKTSKVHLKQYPSKIKKMRLDYK